MRAIKEKQQLIDGVKKGLEGIEIGYFHTGQSFPDLPYYEYFGDPDKEVRRYSFAVLVVKLGHWECGCGFPFHDKSTELKKYVKSFLNHHMEIKRDFPCMTDFCIEFFKRLLEGLTETSSEYWKFEIGSTLYDDLKKEILAHDTEHLFTMKEFLQEINVAPFFKSDQ